MIDCEKVKKLALENGFKLKEQASGNLDLNSYVYDFAEALLKDKQAEIDSLKAQQKLNKPARVGGTVFREGVAWKTVIECAQRHYDYAQRDTQPTPLISPNDAIKLASGELLLVPKEPTEKMMHSALMTVIHNNGDVKAMYKVMIEAAQENSHE